jgi:glycine cleavage system H lipoate-binding protein
MLTGLFVILVVTALVLRYVLAEAPTKDLARPTLPLPRPITLGEAVEPPPEAVSLQPTFTWTRVRRNGEMFLGIHPLLTSLLGLDYSLELLPDDAAVEEGEPLLKIQCGKRELQVYSPVRGVVVEGNADFSPLPGWEGSTMRGGSWVYRIEPVGKQADTPLWLQGEDASAWAHLQYRKIRDFLFRTEIHADVGLAAADGGEIPAGVMSQLDDSDWEAFQASFLHCPEDLRAE